MRHAVAFHQARQPGAKSLLGFRVAEPLSFVGVAKTLVLMSVPYGGVVAIKRALSGGRAA